MASVSPSPSPSPALTYDVANLTVYDYFGYNPSEALASTAIALYGAATILVALLVFVYKHARYVHLVTVTGLMEAGGYIGLLWMILNTGKANLFSAYVAMQVLIILAPNLLQATDYWTISRVVVLGNLSNESFIFRPNILRATFILADLGALIVQAVGISIWATSQASGHPNQQKITTGSIVTLVGLTLQLFFFFCFFVLTVIVQRHKKNTLKNERGYKQLFAGVYLTILLVTIRNIFRWAEFLQSTLLTWPPPESTFVLAKNQPLFYSLDTLPILLAFLAFIIFHPSRLLPRTKPHSPEDPKTIQVWELQSSKSRGGTSESL